MNDNVRIYLVDEYCAGASHFCFSERKDVVLLEDYEKLRAENEKLKGEIWKMESKQSGYEHFLRNEIAKLKCLTLHLFWKYAERLMWKCDGMYKCAPTPPTKDRYLRKCIRWEDVRNKCYKAYRKAKNELMEEKNEVSHNMP